MSARLIPAVIALASAAAPLTLSASAPSWMDASVRSALWPADSYYVGLWTQEITGSRDQACGEALQSARAELVKSLFNDVDVTTVTEIKSVDTQSGLDESETFSSRAVEKAKAQLVNVSSDIYIHPDEPMVTAIARVSRGELSEYNLTALRQMLDEAGDMLAAVRATYEAGDKKLALERCNTLFPVIADAPVYMHVINAVGLHRDKGLELYSAITRLGHEAERFIREASQSITVCLDFDERLAGRPVGIISGRLQALLSDNGCVIVDSPDGADYVVSLAASTRASDLEPTDGVTYVFADVEVKLLHAAKGKTLYSSEYSRKGGGLNYERAARKALENVAKDLGKIVAEKIK